MDLSIKANRHRSPIVDLDPALVRLTARRRPALLRGLERLEHAGLPWPLKRGSWDYFSINFSDHPTFREVAALLEADLDYERLPGFRAAVFRLRQRGSVRIRHLRRNRLFENEADIRKHYQSIADLICSVRDEGYNLDSEAGIGLGIGRHGQLIKLKHGHHRLAVAHLLGVPKVRFRVIAIHPKWLLHRVGDDTLLLGDALNHILNES